MDEAEFIHSIDANLPYNDLDQCKSLIKQGTSISDNASFMVLHELCRPPRGTKFNCEKLLLLIDEWVLNNTHPISELVADIGKKMLQRGDVSVETSISVMNEIKPYKGLNNALAIPYFACNDIEGKADKLWDEIIKDWRAC